MTGWGNLLGIWTFGVKAVKQWFEMLRFWIRKEGSVL